MKTITLSPCIVVATVSPAFAHLGHVGEVAGHGHLIAIGAALAAGILAGLVAKASKSNEVEADPQDDEQEEGEPEKA